MKKHYKEIINILMIQMWTAKNYIANKIYVEFVKGGMKYCLK